MAEKLFHVGPAATNSLHRFVYDDGLLLFDPDGRRGEAPLAIAYLEGAPDLTADDILIR